MITPPKFWFRKSMWSLALLPLGWIYGAVVRWKLKRTPPRLSVPVICIGNLTLGGTGKTPVVLGLAQELQKQGHVPHILTRGYGGKGWQSIRVDLKLHTPKDVGDEPCLLTRVAPTWVGSNRYQSGQEAIAAGATVLLMDDGLQNSTVYQDCKIAVFDGSIPFENQYVFPAGPLREPFFAGLKRLDHLILLNFDSVPAWAGKSSYSMGKTVSDARPNQDLYIAFAAIGHPEKFFNFLEQQGFKVIERCIFPDHHHYNNDDIQGLLGKADFHQAQLITTEKDLVKIPKNVRKKIQTVNITLKLDWAELVNKVLKKN